MPSPQQNVTNIPSNRVDFIDPKTGLVTREWYRFFVNLFNLSGAGGNQTSLDDLQVGPPPQPTTTSSGGGSGTVTSVDMTVPTGLAVSGNPITTAGTLAVTYASGYAIPTTAKQTQWDTAYTNTLHWDGSATSLVAATGRTSLGGTTVGQNFFTLPNPSAITFVRINADNSVSTLDAATFRTAIGAGTGGGTVTSVAATAGTGISVTGSPITTSGTLNITNTAPDQVVAISSGTGISVTGTYPNFTVTNTSPSSGGTVTAVTGTSPVVSSGGTTPAISLASGYGDTQNPYASKTANYFLAAPSGSAGVPTFRAMVAADVPTLNQNTTGTASNVTGIIAVANGGTGLTSLTANYIPYGNGTSAYSSSANFTYNGTYLRVGSATPLTGATNPIVAATGNANQYIQSYVYNTSTGTSASADVVAYADNSTDAHGWADMGFTSSTYADATYTVTGPNEAYVFGSAPSGASKTGNLVYATDNTGTENAHQFYAGGFTQTKSAWRVQITSTLLQAKGTLQLMGSTSGYVGLKGAAAAGSTTYTLPAADGTTGQALTTNGSGTLTWSTPSGSSNITSQGLWENNATISSNYTITSGNNAMSAGKITIASGVTVTVPSGSTWTIV